MNGEQKAPSHRRFVTPCVVVICAIALLALGASAASAAPGHSVLETFGTGAGSNPVPLDVDSSGDVYVLTIGGQTRLQKFDAAGNPVAFTGSTPYIVGNSIIGTPAGQFGEEPPYFEYDLAVDRSTGPTAGYIYVDFTDLQSIYVFAPSGVYAGRVDYGGRPCGVDIAESSGDVFMTSYDGGILRFPPSTEPDKVAPDAHLNIGACRPAVDGSGNLYVANRSAKYAASQFGAETPVSSATFQPEIAPAIAVDQADGEFFLDEGGQVQGRNSAGTLLGGPFGSLTESKGLTVEPGGPILATDRAGGVFVFGRAQVQLPVATTGPAPTVGTRTATVEGSVDPDSAGTVTGCAFRYGLDSGYSASVPCEPGGSITTTKAVTAHLTGLISGATYHYRLFVTNANGTGTGADGTLTTTAAVEGLSTAPATAVTKEGADLGGGFNGTGEDTHYYFEWGRTIAYGNKLPAPPGEDAGSGTGPQTVAPVHLGGLVASTNYHFRIVASNANGTTYGQDENFTTATAVTGLQTDPPSGITATSVELNASFEADSHETHYYFEWGPSTQYGHTSPAPPGNPVAPGSGRVNVPPVTISGLEPGNAYHYRVIAENSVGRTISADAVLKTAEAPVVSNIDAREVQVSSAELTGEINPRNGDTHYQFEWGPTATYGNSIPVPAADIGSGNAPVKVSAPIGGLESSTTYHFRLVASNPYGTTTSPDQTFGFYPARCPNAQVRQETRSNDLPDCRAYELVTPSFAQGALVIPLAGPEAPRATNPARIAYGASFGVFPEETGDPTNLLADIYVSTRTDQGWKQKYIGLPATQVLMMGGPPMFCEDNLSLGRFGPSRAQLGTQADIGLDRVIDYDRGWPGGRGLLGEPSNAPYVWDTTSGGLLERWPSNLAQVPGANTFVGVPEASADFSHFVFTSNVVFAPGGQAAAGQVTFCPTFPPVPEPAESVYDDATGTGQVALASVKSNGEPFQGHVYAISEDGSHIVMAEARKEETGQFTGPLYVRVDANRTYELAPGKQIRYAGSTVDGETIYLTSSERLSPEDHDSSVDLYVWHQSEPNKLTLVSAGTGGAGNADGCAADEGWTSGCDIQLIDFKKYAGANREYFTGEGFSNGHGGNGTSDSYLAAKSGDIYFESPEQLVGAKGEVGMVNLYLYREGTLRYVTTMSPKPLCSENGEFEPPACSSGPVARMQVTRDGTHMALITASHLTGYDSGERGEMYVYDARTGRLVCASCRPDGKMPQTEVFGSQNGLFLTEDGRAFFSTGDPLVPRDTDGVEDIYEYTEGKAQLISAGLGTSIVGYAGFTGIATSPGLVSVSANGTDVYFATLDNLVSQDHNGSSIKIYDARTGGGFAAERFVAPCEAADECHGKGSSALTPTPDRTSAELGKPHKKKAHKKKHHKKAKHHKTAANHRKGHGKPKGKSAGGRKGANRG